MPRSARSASHITWRTKGRASADGAHRRRPRIGDDFPYVFKGGPEGPPRPPVRRRPSLRAFGARSADAAGREEGAAAGDPITSRSAGPNIWWLGPGRRL